MHASKQNIPNDETLTPPEFLTERELAAKWKLTIKALQKWRLNASGPIYYKLGRSVRYALTDINEFERLNRIIPSA